MNEQRAFALTVGPVLGYWSRRALHDFYADVADSCAETVVIGEVVCARRREMKLDDWLALGAELRSAGKEVVLGTQVLIESESDLRLLRRQAGQREFLVEAGDASALNVLAAAGVPFVLGPHINIYSAAALREHRRLGAVRWVAPAELPLASLARINPPAPDDGAAALGPDHGAGAHVPDDGAGAHVPDDGAGAHVPDDGACAPVATEVLAFGRLPLAFSARCFTARHHKLSKDSCDFRCADDADGLLLSTTDGTPFLALNGIQTLSAARHCLIGERAALLDAGVTRLRLSPSAAGFAEVLALFDAVMNHGAPADVARRRLEAMAWPGGLANGYAGGGAGLQWTGASA